MLKYLKTFIIILSAIGLLYGIVRLYFAVTDGFTLSNIISEWQPEERWNTRSLTPDEEESLEESLKGDYVYLGKGCQAYVFASADGKYVIKFFKYQRFRPQSWINFFSFIPFVERYQQSKAIEKKAKLDKVFRSWKIAFEDLEPETGVVFVHLNKTPKWQKTLTIKDKIGFSYQLELGNLEFLIQKRASMLCPTIDLMMTKGASDDAKQLLDKLLAMVFWEYWRGFADNDHALMQNTGVIVNQPVHIDVGQFIYNDIVRDPTVYKKEIYDKMFKLRFWLKKRYPVLAQHLENRLVSILGIDYFYMSPYVHKGDVAKIPHQETIKNF